MPRYRKLGSRCLDLGRRGQEMSRSRNRGIGQRCLHLDISCLDVDIGAYI